MGQAAVALSTGSDALWWNPALVSRGPREFALHIGSSLATSDGGADATGSFLFPIRGVGAFGLGVRYLDFGPSAAVDTSGTIQTGTFENVTTIIVGTFSAPFGNRASAGLSLKFLQLSFPCTGTCSTPTTPPRTGALDFGAQYLVFADSTVVIGAAVRSLGPKLQVNDSPQADPLPSRFDAGIALSPKFAQWPKEVRFRAAADIITGGGGVGFGFGGELAYFERLQARVGYIVNGPSGSGPTLGLGFVTGRLQIDFAEARNDAVSTGGKQPTYLSLRYGF